MEKATLYTTDNKITDIVPADGKQFTLKELQGFVKGYIEIAYIQDDMIFVCNEEGKLENLSVNFNATAIWMINFGPTDVIVGDVAIIHKSLMQ
jgi:hypothetical protein